MKTRHSTRIQHLVLLFLATTLLAMFSVGCNTAHGFGKDVENAGEGIQNGTK